MKRFALRAAHMALVVILPILAAHTAAPESPDGPLAPFERLMGGRWSTGQSYHTFEWGFGNKTVVAKTFSVAEDGKELLVAHAIWFWHPQQQTIIGYSIVEQMPFELMEMTSRFEDGTLVNELRAIAADGSASEHIETWEFVGDDRYDWTLYREQMTDDDVWMIETYTRQ